MKWEVDRQQISWELIHALGTEWWWKPWQSQVGLQALQALCREKACAALSVSPGSFQRTDGPSPCRVYRLCHVPNHQVAISGPALVVQAILNSLQRYNTHILRQGSQQEGWEADVTWETVPETCINLYPLKILPTIKPDFELGFDSLLVLGWFFSGIKVFIILTCAKPEDQGAGISEDIRSYQ